MKEIKSQIPPWKLWHPKHPFREVHLGFRQKASTKIQGSGTKHEARRFKKVMDVRFGGGSKVIIWFRGSDCENDCWNWFSYLWNTYTYTDLRGSRWVSNSPLKGLLEIPWTHGNQIVWQDAGILSQTLTSLAQASRAHWTVWEWGAWRVCDPEYVNV